MFTSYSLAATGEYVRDQTKQMQFPAGEQHIVPAEIDSPGLGIVTGANMDDYAMAGMWIDAQHQAGMRAELYIPYLPGARQDRGNPFGAQVYANLINALGADAVYCLDPHSEVMVNLIENATALDPILHLKAALFATGLTDQLAGVICPDAGAQARTARTAAALGVPVFQARKHRDFATGKLSGFSCEPLPTEGYLLVVDDICDGGGTFNGLASVTGVSPERLGLFVTHGVFSGTEERGAPTLRGSFGQIFTTDSHPGHARTAVATYISAINPADITNEVIS